MKILKAKPVFSIALLCAMGLVGAQPVASFDFGATAADTIVNSPTGSVAGTSFIVVNGVATVEVLDTGFGDLNLRASRGLADENDLSVLWTTTATAVNSVAPPTGSILAQSPGVYGDYVRQGDIGRTLGLRLNGLVAGEYEIFATVNAPPTAQDGRNTAIGVFSGTMPTDTQISDLSQTSVASWANFDAGLTSWTPSTSGSSDWNVLRGVVTISNTSDWVVLHLENGTTSGHMGISSMQIVAIPEPGTLLLVGIALGSLLFFRRRR